MPIENKNDNMLYLQFGVSNQIAGWTAVIVMTAAVLMYADGIISIWTA